MESPLKILGIDFSSREKLDVEASLLEKKLQEMIKIREIHEERFKRRFFRSMSGYSISGATLEAMLNERFILGLPLDKKFFDAKEIKELSDRIEMLQREDEQTPDKIREEKTINQSIVQQSSKIGTEIREYTRILENYRRNPNNREALEDFMDLYIRTRFEQSIMDLSKEISKQVSPAKTIEANQSFEIALISNPKYRELLSAYNKVSTRESRRELIPEIYVLNKLADSSEISTIDSKEVGRLLVKEKKYHQEWMEDRRKGNFAKNQNHDHAWGIILTDPTYLMQDESVDTPIFQGKMTVECIGKFSEQSLFRKVKTANSVASNKRANTEIKKPTTLRLINPFKKQKEEPTMRDRYYEYRASKELYDHIYRVTKTDSEGITTTNIVFSPLTLSNISNGDVNLDFVKNVYFSDYMLDIAKENGGYAGEIIESKMGSSISNANHQEEIAAAILFEHGIPGSIMDARNKRKIKHTNVTRKDFLKILEQKEMERERDE